MRYTRYRCSCQLPAQGDGEIVLSKLLVLRLEILGLYDCSPSRGRE